MSEDLRALSAGGRLRPAAVRQRSASLSRAPARLWRSPRPAPPRKSAIFFVPCHPRPFMFSIIGRAGIGCRSSDADSGNGNGFGNAFGNRQSVLIQALAPAFPTFPAFARPCNTHARAHMCISLPSLGTWEQGQFIYVGQGVSCSQGRSHVPFPAAGWERATSSAAFVQGAFGRSNKIATGYGFQRPLGGDARRKFRVSIASIGRVEQLVAAGATWSPLGGDARRKFRVSIASIGRVEQLVAAGATWSKRNGGFLPFFAAADRHVGRAMLDGSAQRTGNAGLSADGQKLRQLQAELDRAPGAFALAPIGRPTPGAPNGTRAVPCMLALQALGPGFELATGPIPGHFDDRHPLAIAKRPQRLASGRGPGGLHLAIGRAEDLSERGRVRSESGPG